MNTSFVKLVRHQSMMMDVIKVIKPIVKSCGHICEDVQEVVYYSVTAYSNSTSTVTYVPPYSYPPKCGYCMNMAGCKYCQTRYAFIKGI